MKKKISITLYTSEILHDVENTAYLTGKGRQAEGNESQVALMQASADPEDSDRIMRSIGTAYNSLYNIFGEYISDDTEASTNALWERGTDLTINLLMPSNFNRTATDIISTAAHEYVVNSALGDWFNITDKNDAEEYYTKASAYVTLLKTSLCKRVRPQRSNPEPVLPPKLYDTYFGVVAESFLPTESTVKALTKTQLSDRAFMGTAPKLTNQKICYAYPKAMGTLISIKDASNLEYIQSYEVSTVIIDKIEYLCYVLRSSVTLDNPIIQKYK